MWDLDCRKSWAPKNQCFWTVVKETVESPLDSKEITPVHHKGNLSWIFIGRTDAKAEALILWLPDAKNWLIGKVMMLWEIIEGRRRHIWQRMSWSDGITDAMDMSLSKPWSWWWTRNPGVLQYMGSQRVGHDWVTQLNWWYRVCNWHKF